MSDMDLAREFVCRNSEPAFTELVNRHINLVYSVALRYVHNAQDAEDVTQAVFIILARKVEGIGRRNTLAGWLYETTRFTASRFVRARARRQIREQEACMASNLNDQDSDSVWGRMAPLLEEAMARLSAKERELIVLRYFENRTGKETAALLGIAEAAAHKRTERAIAKLQQFFSRREISVSAPRLIGAALSHAIHTPPVGLAKAISAGALAKGVAASGSSLNLVRETLRFMAWTKAKTAIIAAATVFLTAVSATTLIVEHQRPREFFPRKSWDLAGYATPESAFESAMWAASQGDLNAFVTSMTPGGVFIENNQGRSEAETVAKNEQDLENITAYRIIVKETVSTNQVILTILPEGEDSAGRSLRPSDAGPFLVQRIDGKWKVYGSVKPEERQGLRQGKTIRPRSPLNLP